MIRLHAVVEGQTEETFVKQILAPALWPFDVYATAHSVTTNRKKSKRGGLPGYGLLRNDLTLWMKQDQNADARFTTMIDLYGLPSDFPGYESCRTKADPLERVICLEKMLREDVPDLRFTPYIQLHEFEALVLSDAVKLAEVFPNRVREADRLAEVRSRYKSPEHIDEGTETAPSKRIREVIPEYVKRVSGPQVLARIGMATLRGQCGHFDDWIRRLEGLVVG